MKSKVHSNMIKTKKVVYLKQRTIQNYTYNTVGRGDEGEKI